MRIISVNVGSVRQLGRVRGKPVYSGFVKKPVSGVVNVGKLNLEGDRQADLTVHGGVDKAVYAYSSEHYPYWVAKYPKMEIPWGTFGENFTTEGLLENEVHVGDRLGVGSAEFAVTQPRFSLLQARSEIWNPSHPQNFSRLRKVRILSQGSARREGQSWRSDKDDRG